MTKDEALKMAIEALETCITYSRYEQWFNTELVEKALESGKEALEQPAQEPVAMYENGNVNWINTPKDNSPLYTHPAPSWQGLSDDEIEVIDADCWVYPIDAPELFNHYKFARAIEQALKEKNT